MSFRPLLLALLSLLLIGERGRPTSPSSSPLRALRFETDPEHGFVAQTRSGRIALDSLRVVGGRRTTPVPSEPLLTKMNYLVGDRRTWRTNVETFGKVTYPSVLDGVDLVFHGEDGQLEYDFIVAPGVDPARIAIEVGRDVALTPEGDLRIGEAVVQKRPHVYQADAMGMKHDIASSYRVTGREIAFNVAEYDRTLPLVIDPIVTYDTSFSTADGETFLGVAAVGDVGYVIGTMGDAVPAGTHAIHPVGSVAPFGSDAFVAKIDAAGNAEWITVYGGATDFEEARGVTADAAGRVYVAGTTRSTDLPTTANAFATTYSDAPGSNSDGFVFTLNGDGTALTYASYLDFGSYSTPAPCGLPPCYTQTRAADSINGIAVADGRVFVAGRTHHNGATSTTTPFFRTTPSLPGAFIAEITVPADGVTTGAIVATKYLGGGGAGAATETASKSVAAGDGHVYAGGIACADLTEGITAGSFQPTRDTTNCDGFAAVYPYDLSTVTYGTYAGGPAKDMINGVAIGRGWFGDTVLYAIGTIEGGALPNVTQPPDKLPGVGRDAMVFAFAPTAPPGTAPPNRTYWARLWGGDNDDYGIAVAVDATGNPWFAGSTRSSDFPTRPTAANADSLDQIYATRFNAQIGTHVLSFLHGATGVWDTATGIATTTDGVLVTANHLTDDPRHGFVFRIAEPPFSVLPSSATVHPGETVQLTATGGYMGTYAFGFQSKESGPDGSVGFVDGLYHAGSTPGTDVVQVNDGDGHATSVTITVVAVPPPDAGADAGGDAGADAGGDAGADAGSGDDDDTTPSPNLTVTPVATNVAPKASLQVHATGGVPPYQYALVTNASNGAVSGNGLYVAGARGSVVDRVRVTDQGGHAAVTTINVTPGITILPATSSIAQNATLKLTAQGGKGAPYTWSATAGTITQDGNFTAPLQHVVVQITATDGLGNTATVPVAIGEAIAISPLDAQTFPHGSVQFSAFGGDGNYTFALITNPPVGGEIAPQSGLFTANTIGNTTETVDVKDGANRHASTTITIGPSLTVAPEQASVAAGGNVQLSAAGGSGLGYTFSLETNASGGNVDPATGVFTAGANAGLDVVRLADSAGNEARATITVTAAPPAASSSSGAAASGSSGATAKTTGPATAVGGGDEGCRVGTSGGHPQTMLLVLGALLFARRRRR